MITINILKLEIGYPVMDNSFIHINRNTHKYTPIFLSSFHQEIQIL